MKYLVNLIDNLSAKIGIIGIGEHGLRIAADSANAGFVTTGFDSRPFRAEMINGRQNYIEGYKVENYDDIWYNEMLHGTTDFGSAAGCDVVMLCIEDHISASIYGSITLESSLKAISAYLRKGSAVILISENEIGCSLEKAAEIIAEASGYNPNSDFTLSKADVNTDAALCGISALGAEPEAPAAFFERLCKSV